MLPDAQGDDEPEGLGRFARDFMVRFGGLLDTQATCGTSSGTRRRECLLNLKHFVHIASNLQHLLHLSTTCHRAP